ncbi:helix-turn-helix domain-containing protein [Leuconostoc lactis]|uniref:helix-turn-helix domain-containing protein n=1 Tax=Leuconostoc lactis TaxID=1246 RepID=UPI00331628B4
MSVTAERIQQLRQQKKLTQSELAELVGTTRVTVGRIERDINKPSIGMLSLIADALDTTMDYLQGRTDNALKTSHNSSNDGDGKKRVDLADDELIMSFEGKELSEDYKNSILAFVKMLREERK